MCEVGNFCNMVFGVMPPSVQGRTVLKLDVRTFIPAILYDVITQMTTA